MKITPEVVEQLRQKELKELLARKEEHEALKLVLASYEGKRITSRSKIAPFRLNHSGCISGKYDHFFINPVEVKRQDYTNRCNCNIERISNLEKLDVERVAKVFAQIQEGFDAVLQGFWEVDMQNLGAFHNPLYYDLTRLIGGEDCDMHKLYEFRRARSITMGAVASTRRH